MIESGTLSILSDISRETEQRTRMELSFTLAFDDNDDNVVYELRLDALDWRVWRYEIP